MEFNKEINNQQSLDIQELDKRVETRIKMVDSVHRPRAYINDPHRHYLTTKLITYGMYEDCKQSDNSTF